MDSNCIVSANCFFIPDFLINLTDGKYFSFIFLYFNGEKNKSRELQKKLLPLADVMFSEVNPIPVKKAMQLIGLDRGIVRAPLTELEKEHEPALIKTLESFGFKF